MKLDDLVGNYVKLRDKKQKLDNDHKAKMAGLNSLMDRIEAEILKALDANGLKSFNTEAGMAYKSLSTSATVADWEQFFAFVQQNEHWHMLEHRVSKSAVEQYKAAEGDLPPGVNWREEVKIGVRRPS